MPDPRHRHVDVQPDLQAVHDISVDQLKVWLARTAAAETLDEIFGWLTAARHEPWSGARESPVVDCEEGFA